MAHQPTPSGSDPGFASRLPWLLLGLFALGLVVVGVVIFLNRSSPTTVSVNAPPAAPSPTVVVLALASPTPPPTPTQPPPTATETPARPTSTRVPTAVASAPPPTPTSPAAPTEAPTSAPPAAPTAAPPLAPALAPTEAPTTAPTTLPTATVPAASPTPTPFTGEVADPGGLGNTRSNIDAAYGPPTGETPAHLVVYKKGTLEYHVGFTASQPRALLIAEIPPPNAPLTQDAATAASRRLFPHDAQPRAQQPEGNNAFAVERFTSPLLGQVVPPNEARTSQPGDFLVVYGKDSQGRINRLVVGVGDDPTALLNR